MIAMLLLATLASDRVAVPPAQPISRARYIARRSPQEDGLAVPAHRSHGFTQRSRLLPDGSTEVTVVASRAGSRGAGVDRPAEATAALASGARPAPEIAALAQELAHPAADDWDTSAAIIMWVSLNIAHADHPAHDESGPATLAAGQASCVGRAVLAADLLRAAGIPARTLHGLLLTDLPDGPQVLLHRFLETWIDGVGWVPSDPGESVHLVDARHVVLGTDAAPYDPAAQASLRVRFAEPPDASWAHRGGPVIRPLIVADRPAPVTRGLSR